MSILPKLRTSTSEKLETRKTRNMNFSYFFYNRTLVSAPANTYRATQKHETNKNYSRPIIEKKCLCAVTHGLADAGHRRVCYRVNRFARITATMQRRDHADTLRLHIASIKHRRDHADTHGLHRWTHASSSICESISYGVDAAWSRRCMASPMHGLIDAWSRRC